MKRSVSVFLAAIAALLCLLCGTASAAAEALPEIVCVLGENAVIGLQTAADGEVCLFLPSAADPAQLVLAFGAGEACLSAEGESIAVRSGEAFDLLALFPDGLPAEGGAVCFSAGEETASLRILRSENIPALFLTSGSPETDRLWVEQDKENRAEGGSMVLLRADGTAVFDGALKNIKGRGNSTWLYPKKPYQIKLEKKADLLETGLPEEAEKTWVLLANYCDRTLLHNSVSFDIAARLGLACTPHSRPVDLYYDGSYRGSYLLCEKTEVGEGRVAIADMEKAYEKANPEVADLSGLPTAQSVNRYGNRYQYVDGLASPADLNGGYLLEIDYGDRAEAEKSWFTTTHGYHVVCKSPECAGAEAVAYISEQFQQLENAVFGGGTDPETGKRYDELVDVDSLVRVYLLEELSMDPDAFRSSCFFYRQAGGEKLYAGPVWDFDSGYGSAYEVVPTEAVVAAENPLVRELLRIPEFRQRAAEVCGTELTGLVAALLSCDDSGLPTLDGYAREIAASRSMNDRLWPRAAAADPAAVLAEFRELLAVRVRWLEECLYADAEFSPLTSAFFDVPAESWYHDDVLFTVEQGVFNGTAYGYFSPDMAFTRGMAVTILYRMSGQPPVSGDSRGFTDVSPGVWYHDAALWASVQGVAMGYEDGSFRPDEEITRQDFVTLFYRWAGSPELPEAASVPETPEAASDPEVPEAASDPEVPEAASVPEVPETMSAFEDREAVADYARGAVGWAVSAGLLRGDDHGRLLPLDTLTRAQAAALLHRYLCLPASAAETDPPL